MFFGRGQEGLFSEIESMSFLTSSIQLGTFLTAFVFCVLFLMLLFSTSFSCLYFFSSTTIHAHLTQYEIPMQLPLFFKPLDLG